jgi:hypothetical protein
LQPGVLLLGRQGHDAIDGEAEFAHALEGIELFGAFLVAIGLEEVVLGGQRAVGLACLHEGGRDALETGHQGAAGRELGLLGVGVDLVLRPACRFDEAVLVILAEAGEARVGGRRTGVGYYSDTNSISYSLCLSPRASSKPAMVEISCSKEGRGLPYFARSDSVSFARAIWMCREQVRGGIMKAGTVAASLLVFAAMAFPASAETLVGDQKPVRSPRLFSNRVLIHPALSSNSGRTATMLRDIVTTISMPMISQNVSLILSRIQLKRLLRLIA